MDKTIQSLEVKAILKYTVAEIIVLLFRLLNLI